MFRTSSHRCSWFCAMLPQCGFFAALGAMFTFALTVGSAALSFAETLVLVSSEAGSVVQYSVSGTTWTATGKTISGSYAGSTLNSYCGLAQDSAGNIYVAEKGDGGRILRFNSDLTFSGVVATSISTSYSEGSIAGRPEALNIGSDGSLYLSCAFGTYSSQVYKITNPASDTHAISTFIANSGSINGSGTSLSAPRGIAFDASGNLYVADRNTGRLLEFSSSGAYEATTSVSSASGVYYDGSNLFYSTNGGKVYERDSSGVVTTLLSTTSIGSNILDLVNIDGNIYCTRYNEGVVSLITSTTSVTDVATLRNAAHFLVESVPEPSITAMALTGLGGLLAYFWRKRRK